MTHNKLKMRSYNYLAIDPFVYISCKEEKCMVLDTRTYKFLEINNPKIISILLNAIDKKNYHIAYIGEGNIEDKEVKGFVQKMVSLGWGKMIIKKEKKRPVQIPPVLRISNDIVNYEKDDTSYLTDIKTYIHELFLFLNNDKCPLDWSPYKESFKQIETLRFENDSYKEMTEEIFMDIVNSLDVLPEKISISGSAVWELSFIDKVIAVLNEKQQSLISYNIKLSDALKLKDLGKVIDFSHSYIRLNIIPTDDLTMLGEWASDDRFFFNFLVDDEMSYNKYISVIEKFKVKKYVFSPVLIEKNNLTFFEKSVFLTHEDIFQEKQTIKQILAKGKFNPSLFGKIYFDETGSFFMNLNNSPIGNIKDAPLYLTIYEQFVVNKKNQWFLTRNDVNPCKNCNFALLCPPISNYELYAKKFNFCKIKEVKNEVGHKL